MLGALILPADLSAPERFRPRRKNLARKRAGVEQIDKKRGFVMGKINVGRWILAPHYRVLFCFEFAPRTTLL